MKKIIVSALALSFAAASVMANVNGDAKKVKPRKATCTSCTKGTKCPPSVCTKADCCK